MSNALKILAISLATASGCTSFIPHNKHLSRETVKLDESIDSLVDISNESAPVFKEEFLEEESDTFNFKYELFKDGEKEIEFYYLKSKENPDEKHPLLILFNILNDPEMFIIGLVAGPMSNYPIDCIIIKPNEHFMNNEKPRPVKGENFSGLIDYDAYNIKLIKNLKRITQYWIPSQEGLDGRFAFAGLSLGGMQSVCAQACIPESEFALCVMGGSGFGNIIMHSFEDTVVANRKFLIDLHKQEYKSNKKTTLSDELARIDLYIDLNTRRFSPEVLAKGVPTDKIKMVITQRDLCVPTANQKRLYRELGAPDTVVFPSGHYTIGFYYFSLRSQLVDWVKEGFGIE